MVTPEAFWDKVAAKYDRSTVKGPNYAARIERAAQWIGPDASVLDAGCAGGQITLDLAEHVHQILGIDLSDKLIGCADRRRRELGARNASFRVAKPEDASLLPGSFDAITAYSLLHLVDDPLSTLRRFQELLKPDGTLILELPSKEEIGLHLRVLIKLLTALGKAPVVKLFRMEENKAMIRQAGFEIAETKVYNPKSMNTSILARKR